METGFDMIKGGVYYIGIGVVFFCHDGNGRVVFNKRSGNARDEQGCWDIGGGGVKKGELLEDALRREVMEEYCTDVLEHEYLGFREVHRVKDGTPTYWIVFDFKVKIDSSCCAIGDPDKMDDIAWHTLDDLPAPMHSQWETYLKKYSDRL